MPITINGTTGIAGVDGTAGTPAVQGTDSNTGIVFGTDTVSLVEGGTTALSVNSDGQTVLGAGTASLPAMSTTGDLNTGTFYPAADTIAWATGGSERMRVDSSGNVGIGTITPNFSGYGATNLTVSGGTTIQGVIELIGTRVDNDGSAAGDINFFANSNSSGNKRIAFIQVSTEGATANNRGGAMIFQTKADNGPLSERIRINNSGAVKINNLAGTGSRAVNADASGVLSAASDMKLKREVASAQLPGLDEILQLQPRAYQWLSEIERIGDDAAVEVGFFANEVAPIIPSAAPKGLDGLYGFYDRSVTAALVLSIQELSAKLDAAEARIAALEAN